MAGVTWTYTYDDAGNLRTKQLYPYSEGTLGSLIRTYTLGYTDSDLGDLQTHWCGEAFSTDVIGNLTYDGDIYYTWEHGRELTRMEYGSTVWDITYDADGMRTSRTNGTRTYNYTYNGSRLSRMTVDGHTLDFTYDSSGRPLSVTYDGTPYFYVLSLQGDVMAILDSSGTAVVSYTYSAYGSSTYFSGSMRDTLGYYNPLRYRGYVYDQEYGLYYLQSRYYNAGLGRFNAPDAFASTGQGLLGNNMFAYCNNNPVNYSDSTGTIGRIATKGEYAQLDEIGIGGAFPIPIDPGFIDWLEEQLSKITDKMTLSLSKATSRSYKTDYEEHHIAAKKAKNAVAAAKILNEVLPGGVESTQNKVMVYTDVHRRIHTNLYYTLANSVIIYAYESANGDKLQQIKNVNVALLYLRTFIETLNSLSNIN